MNEDLRVIAGQEMGRKEVDYARVFKKLIIFFSFIVELKI